MNWDDPQERARLMEQVSTAEYHRLLAEHQKQTVIDTVSGHEIRAVATRWGRLYAVGDTGRAHATIEGARKIARGEI